jgi:hypothetical protein
MAPVHSDTINCNLWVPLEKTNETYVHMSPPRPSDYVQTKKLDSARYESYVATMTKGRRPHLVVARATPRPYWPQGQFKGPRVGLI